MQYDMQPPPRSSTGLLLAFGIMLWTLLVYAFLYQAGRVLITIAENFLPISQNALDWGAGAQTAGQASDLQLTLFGLSGMALPLLAWLVFIFFVPRQTGTPLEALKLISAYGILLSLLPWMVIPLFFQNTQTMVGEDVTLVLVSSGIDHRLIAGLFFVLSVAVYSLARAKIRDTGALRLLIFNIASDIGWNGQRGFYAITGVILAGVIVAWMVFMPTGGANNQQTAPPPGYQFVREYRLAGRDVEDMPLVHFSRTAPRTVNLVFELRDFSAEKIDLRLEGPNELEVVLLHTEDYSTAFFPVEFSQELWYGEYQVLLNSQKAFGRIKIYIKWD
jgi:hypothetical protein